MARSKRSRNTSRSWAVDLRGHGDSSKPDGGENHNAYAKRSMARDQVLFCEDYRVAATIRW